MALAQHDQFMERYHYALCKEVEQFGQVFKPKMPIQTIFLGGGTPSTWPDRLLLDMFVKLKNRFSFAGKQEITIEVNPGTVRTEQLQLWKQIGINRLSIGVQTLNDDVLRRLNRHQTKDDVYFLLNHASTVFDNISVDLIVGFPDVTHDEWKYLLEEVVRWPITHVSVYCLTVHEETKLYFEYKCGNIAMPDDDEVATMYEWGVEFFETNNFIQYEVSNFARPGYESKHNLVYWERKLYKGFGLGACSFDGAVRSQNQKSLMEYINALESGQTVTIFEERLTEDQVRLEIIMLGLRTTQGVCCAQMFDEFSQEEKARRVEHIKWLKQNNFMYEKNGHLLLTSKGLVVEHEIIATFFS